MNIQVPIYTARPWWQTLAEGMAGRPSDPLAASKIEFNRAWQRQKLEAHIAARRAAATARMKRIRTASERGVARLIREYCL
jgi:hypothetical protein